MSGEVGLRAALDAADAEAVRRGDEVAAGARRLRYHVMPPVGWLNDPNGFVQFRGQYHLFFQYNPYFPEGVASGMHWGHYVSDDLVRWRLLPTALAPSEDYDSEGCWSGSAIVDDEGRLVLMYTGVASNGALVSGMSQNIAVSDDGVRFEKSSANPVIPLPPEGTRDDFRDPKFLQVDDVTYAVVGASADSKARLLVYRASADLREWSFVGVAAESASYGEGHPGHDGTMWECPDLFPLGDRFVLMTYPMHVTDASTIVEVGTFDPVTGRFVAESRRAFDVGENGACQTMVDSTGRRIVIGWMHHGGGSIVTTDEGWVGALTIPRELELVDGRVRQRPVKELESLRGEARPLGPVSVGPEGAWADTGLAAEVRLLLDADGARKFRVGVRVSADRGEQTSFVVDRDRGRVVCDRSLSGEGPAAGSVTEFDDPAGDLELRFFLDTISVELFVDDGAAAVTHLVYPADSSTGFFVEPVGDGTLEILDLTIWPLDSN
jgi:beta-fructofuranosidase